VGSVPGVSLMAGLSAGPNLVIGFGFLLSYQLQRIASRSVPKISGCGLESS
jgi:hypothetical protein